MPRGWITLDGPKLQYARMFGMTESYSPKYPPRTDANVLGADATIRLAFDFTTAGERLTLKCVKQCEKPHKDVDLNDPISYQSIVDWIVEGGFETLNVAGNSHKTNPAVGLTAFNYLVNVFAYLTGEFDAEYAEGIRGRFRIGIYKH